MNDRSEDELVRIIDEKLIDQLLGAVEGNRQILKCLISCLCEAPISRGAIVKKLRKAAEDMGDLDERHYQERIARSSVEMLASDLTHEYEPEPDEPD